MTLLLDTNALVWWLKNEPQLGRRASRDIADPSNAVYVSNLSLFECSIKQRIGKLEVDYGALDAAIRIGAIRELAYDTWMARQLLDLPRFDWADPFDAALIAQAVAKKMIVVTADQHILDCRVADLRTMDVRR